MRRSIALLAVLTLSLVACGDDEPTIVADDTTTTADEVEDTTTTEADETTTTSTAPPRVEFTGTYDFDPETGEVDISEYVAYLAEYGPPEGGPEDAALEFLGDPYANEESVTTDVTAEPADGGRTVVIVTYEGLPDDSVAAVRFELVFVGDADDMIFESGSWASRCQEGRGHQEFSTGLCV